MFKRMLERFVYNSFNCVPRVGENGAVGGGDFSVETVGSDPEEQFMRTVMENDDDLADLLDDDVKGDKTPGDDEEDAAADDELGVDLDDDDDDEDTGDDDGEKGSKGSHEEFADDVIPGLRGDDFAKISEDGQLALAEFEKKAQVAMQESSQLKSQLDKLREDPVGKLVAERIDGGKTGEFEVRNLSDAEVASLKEEYGFDDQEIASLKPRIEAVAQDMARAMFTNHVRNDVEVQRARKEVSDGQAMVRNLSEFNKDLAVQETDLSKFYVSKNGQVAYNDSHPEIDKFKNGIGKIQEWASKNGINYGMALRMGPKAFYAAAASALDLPVKFNTGDQDRKAMASVRKQALERFRKTGQASRGLPADRGNIDRASVEKGAVDGGIDVERLATDGDYYEKLLNRKPNNQAWAEKIDAMVARGERLARNKKHK